MTGWAQAPTDGDSDGTRHAGISGSSGISGIAGRSGGGGGRATEALHPPATIDFESCIQFINPDSGPCLSCCYAAGFMSAGFSLRSACVCGTPGITESTVCAGKLDSTVTCTACCATGGYKYGIMTTPQNTLESVCACSNDSWCAGAVGRAKTVATTVDTRAAARIAGQTVDHPDMRVERRAGH